ncbi:hypothetical protein GW17_00044661 [Ensete ventricosum]|nr:hypothetical protein GW17_00044661 [Ensete ventricosum]
MQAGKQHQPPLIAWPPTPPHESWQYRSPPSLPLAAYASAHDWQAMLAALLLSPSHLHLSIELATSTILVSPLAAYALVEGQASRATRHGQRHGYSYGLLVVLVCPVREIEPGDVHAGPEQLLQHRHRPGRRPERAHDLRLRQEPIGGQLLQDALDVDVRHPRKESLDEITRK